MKYLTFLVISRTDIIINKNGMREDLKGWRFHDVIELASKYDKGFKILVELLDDYDSTVRKNALYVIQDMIKEGLLDNRKIKLILDKIIKMTHDSDEKISLTAIETLNLILDRVELDPDDYEKVTNALMKVLKAGIPILSEYAAEGLGTLGAKIAVIASKIIGWLFSLIKAGQKREIQSAAITALTEMAYKTKNKKIVDKIVRGLAEALDEADAYGKEKILTSLERLITRRDMISKRTLSLTFRKVRPLLKDKKFKNKAEMVVLRIMRVAKVDEEKEEVISFKTQLDIDQYSIKDVERLLDSGKQEIVVEMAKHNPEVLEKVIELLYSDEYTKRIDALWVISRVVPYLGPTRAYSILPIIGEFLKSKNKWVKDTAGKVLAEIYSHYQGTSHYIISLLDVLIKSNKTEDLESALFLLKELCDKTNDSRIINGAISFMTNLLEENNNLRRLALSFLAQQAHNLLRADSDTLQRLLKTLQKTKPQMKEEKYREIVTSLIDVVQNILRKRDATLPEALE
ncbi:HEAT repeat domain-containing protein [Thermococcus barophilus]|uniref:Condensin complex subunit 1 C-terminal domain-containing protein n=1 Tax=Thermococcus barophilus TaxID=55802 RepID=A0A0S1XDV6_THEBA|nr:hypothetical protein [Thermococcus barophilus]ALM75912.1 hypothetical protein TBCH5v1_2009 [Thermococcus barophilus]